MISNIANQTIERSDNFQESTFKIKASAKAFRILSDGLYSDKITAIIRELSCNAYDAHVQANNLSTPFWIKLPNNLEPNFMIRDYGTGLSDYDVKNIFTTYFESTKTETNDQVGILGLGSKSPYSYTDNFSVISYFNGVKSVYNMFLNEEQIPSIAKLCEEPTTEHNGLEISFAVKNNNFYEFYSKCAEVLKYFKIKPKITGHAITIPEIKYIQSRPDNWGLLGVTGYARARAVMGNVAYDMSDANFNTLTAEEKLLLSLNIDIFFKIGDLDITPSREKLSYNSITKVNVKNKLSTILKELKEEIAITISNCKSEWEAKIFYYELTNGDMKVFRDIIKGLDLNYNGVPLTNEPISFTQDDWKFFTVISHFMTRSRRRWTQKYSNGTASYILPKSKISFYVSDTKKHIKNRMKKLIQECISKGTENPLIYVIEPTEGQSITDILKVFRKRLGMPDSITFPLLSSLPYDAPTTVSGQNNYNPKNNKKIFKYSHGVCGDNSSWWTPETPDISKGGVYVIINRYKIHDQEPYHYMEKYTELFKTLNLSVDVYGIKEKEFNENFKDNPNWVNLYNYAKTLLQKSIVDENLEEVNAMSIMFNKFTEYYNSPYYKKNVEKYIKYLADLKKYDEVVSLIAEIKSKANKLLLFQEWQGMLEIKETPKEKYTKLFEKFFENVLKDFPMIKVVGQYESDDETIGEYIEQMKNINKMERKET